MASRNGVFHIAYRQYLHEWIAPKLKKLFIGEENYDDDNVPGAFMCVLCTCLFCMTSFLCMLALVCRCVDIYESVLDMATGLCTEYLQPLGILAIHTYVCAYTCMFRYVFVSCNCRPRLVENYNPYTCIALSDICPCSCRVA